MHIAVIGGTGLTGRARKNQRIARIQSIGKPSGHANDSRDPGASHTGDLVGLRHRQWFARYRKLLLEPPNN